MSYYKYSIEKLFDLSSLLLIFIHGFIFGLILIFLIKKISNCNLIFKILRIDSQEKFIHLMSNDKIFYKKLQKN